MPEEYMGTKFVTSFLGREKQGCPEMLSFSGKLAQFEDKNNGNFSLRCTKGFFISSGGSGLGHLKEDDVVLVKDYDAATNTVLAQGPKEPSSESIMHYLIYQRFPETGAILHVHDPELLEKDITTTGKEAPYGTPEIAELALKALNKSSIINLKAHGTVCIGTTLEECLGKILNLRRTK